MNTIDYYDFSELEGVVDYAPGQSDKIYLVDIAAEFHMSEADLGYYCYQHLDDGDFNPYSGTLSNEGADKLRGLLDPEV